MYYVKLQIRINNNLYDAMKDLTRVKKWDLKNCYERAIKQFLESNHFVYHPVLKTYVLDVPNLKAISKTIKLLKETDNELHKKDNKKRTSKQTIKPETARKKRTKETYILEE